MRIRTLAIAVILAGCTQVPVEESPQMDLGDFTLSHNVVVASKATKTPLSRSATAEQLQSAVQEALTERLGRYDGDRLYHIGTSVEGYMLAPPGVPIVASPKSALVLNVTIWDDAAGAKLNDPPEQIVVLESLGTQTLIGSGYTLTPEEQLKELAANAAAAIERFMAKQHTNADWFDGPISVPEPEERSTSAPDQILLPPPTPPREDP